jgi:D-beta-D-heptose 7-phosphate kinase/D-beta-D-heptose 1-phosphate adenosyltransferase
LEAARAKGDRLIVGLNSDASVRRLKGASRPVNNQSDRALVLAALESVDRVVIFGEDTPLEILSAIRPDILAKGADYKACEIAGAEYAGRVVRIPLVKGKSTTSVIKKLSTC